MKKETAKRKNPRKEESEIKIEHVSTAWAMARSNGYESVDRFLCNPKLALEIHHQVEEHFHKKLDIEALYHALVNARKASKL